MKVTIVVVSLALVMSCYANGSSESSSANSAAASSGSGEALGNAESNGRVTGLEGISESSGSVETVSNALSNTVASRGVSKNTAGLGGHALADVLTSAIASNMRSRLGELFDRTGTAVLPVAVVDSKSEGVATSLFGTAGGIGNGKGVATGADGTGASTSAVKAVSDGLLNSVDSTVTSVGKTSLGRTAVNADSSAAANAILPGGIKAIVTEDGRIILPNAVVRSQSTGAALSHFGNVAGESLSNGKSSGAGATSIANNLFEAISGPEGNIGKARSTTISKAGHGGSASASSSSHAVSTHG